MKVRVIGTAGLCDARLEVWSADETALVIDHPNGEAVYADAAAAKQKVEIVWATHDEWVKLLQHGYATG